MCIAARTRGLTEDQMTMYDELELITPYEPLDALEWDLLPGAAFTGLTTAEQKAIGITSTLETGRAGGFDGLTGNFDDMGISFGLVNWNIGAGSLQPLLRDFAREFPQRWRAVFGPHADSFLALIGPKDAASTKAQLAFAKSEMNTKRWVETKKGKKEKWFVKEPWLGYFHRLAADEEFAKVQVRYVRGLLARAQYYCEYFGLASERAFCFMFDAVSSHGKWWLMKKKDGVEWRREILKRKLELVKLRALGRKPAERDILRAIAEMLSETSRDKYKDAVLVRKLWFIGGKAPRNADELARLAPTDAPYTVSAGTQAATPPASPAPRPTASVDPVLDVAVISAYWQGIRNPQDITDAVFFQRNPARKGARIGKHETAAIAEWQRIGARVRQLFPGLDAQREHELAPATEDAVVTPIVLMKIAAGERDPNKLASEAFFALHHERGRRPIARTETAFARQWLRLRSGVVARLLGGAPGPEAQPEIAAGGTSHYLTIDLGDSGKAKPLTGVFVPDGFRAGTDIDVILFLHGHKTGYAKHGSTMAIDRYWAASTTPSAPLREAVAKSGKNVILVAPTLGLTSRASGLVGAGALDAYLDRVLRELTARAKWRAVPRLRHLVLAAHSGGGIWMLKIAQGADPAIRDRLRECWGYDCFYNPDVDRTGWPAWGKANPDKSLIAYYATDKQSKTTGAWIGPTTIAKYLAKLRLPNLRMLPSKERNHWAPLRLHVAERIREATFLADR